MDLGKLGGLVGAVAPTIATALGGPLVGMAVRAISSAIFGHENGTEDDIMNVLGNPTGDQLAQLKKIDADFKVQMKSLDIDLERIAEEDRDSARQMQMTTRDWIPRVLAVGVTFGFFGIVAYILHYGLPPTGGEALLMLIGTLGTAWTSVMGFYFGSSAGSKQKTDALTSALGNK